MLLLMGLVNADWNEGDDEPGKKSLHYLLREVKNILFTIIIIHIFLSKNVSVVLIVVIKNWTIR